MHFTPFDARAISGSGRTLVSLSSFRISWLLSNCALYLVIFLWSKILAAASGNFFVKRDRSRIAPAERIIGGRKGDIESDESACGDVLAVDLEFES